MANAQVTPWVRIAPDGTITILSAGAEMGQGSMTNLPMIVAEEMDADWSKVAIEMAPADAGVYGYMMNDNPRMMAIVGSRATMYYYNDLRTAGAQVRKVLLMNAAERWGVDAATLRTEPGVVINPANGQRLTYGEIAAFGKVPSPLPKVDAKELKARKDWRLIGKGVPRRDTPLKVNGTAIFGIDIKLPGMVYATTLHSPVHNSAPESWNDAEIKAMSGVVGTVQLPNGVAVVADRFEQALAARDALKVVWKKGQAAGFNSEEALNRDYAKIHHDPNTKSQSVHTAGDAKAAFAAAAKVHKAEFHSDYGYHAQMEPLNAVARFNDAGDAIEIWEGTQAPDISRTAVAKALGFKEEQVTHHQCYIGGGFGRRNGGMEAVEAAQIARAVRRPVKLIWTRTEDLAQGRFRPQSFQCLEAATDASGKVTGWKHCVIGDGGNMLLTGGMRIAYYGVPNQSARAARRLAWRADQALARGGARVQRVRDRKLHRPDGGRCQHGPDPVPVRAHGRDAQGAGVLRDRGAHVRLEGGASAGPRHRHLDLRTLGLARRRRGRRSRSTARAARSRCTRSGSRSTAAPSCRPDRPRPISRARSSTGSRACCMSASR